MRTTLRGKITLLFMTFALLLALPAMALADVVSNNLDNTVDATKESMSLQAGGANGSTTLYVKAAEGPTYPQDNPTGCNLKDGKVLVLDVQSSNSAVAEVTSQATISKCADGSTLNGASITVTPKAQGSTEITVAKNATLTTASGTFYVDPATFTVNVSAAAAPADTTKPVIGYTLDPASPDGSAGWYKSNVSLTWTVTENESASSLKKTGCVDQNITADQAATTYSCSATSDGGSAAEQSVTIKRDGTAPVVALGSVSGTAGTDGWYKSAVTQTFDASDATSGLAGPASIPVSSGAQEEGSNVNIASGPVSDNAGNTHSGINAGPFKVDLTDPTNILFVGGPADGQSYDFGSVPAAPTCTAEDAVSGLASCIVTGRSTAVGTHTLTATATDNAGRTATATRSYTVAAATAKGFYSPIDMNNTLNTVKGGSTVPAKFELFGGASGVEQKALSAVSSVSAKQINCATLTGAADAIEEIVSTNATGLRFDTTGDQFIYNWKTPRSPGTCYSLTMTAADQQTKLVAFFKLT